MKAIQPVNRIILGVTLSILWIPASAEILVDTSGEFDEFSQMVINDEGTVAFVGYKDQVGEDDEPFGIYTVTSGGQVNMIVDDTGPFTGVQGPSITNSGEVYFYGVIQDGQSDDLYGVFRGPNIDFSGNLGLDTIIDNINPTVWDGFNIGNCGHGVANDLGDVLFCGRVGGLWQIAARLGGPPAGCTELACEFRDIVQPKAINTTFAMNNNRKVAFVETDTLTFETKLIFCDFSTDPAVTTTLVDTEVDDFDWIHGNISLNNLDNIAFAARKSATSTLGVFTLKPGEQVKTIVEPDAFSIGVGPAINDNDQVAFYAEALGGGFGRGYFITPNLDEPIIQTGDAFGNSEIVDFEGQSLARTLNNNGQLVISVRLANDQKALALAQDSAPINQAFWEATDGDFDDPLNWEPQAVPDEEVTAVFDKDAQYTVNFSLATSDRVLVERGNFLFFSGGIYDIAGGNEEDASIVVGHSTIDPVNLFLINHHALNTLHGTVGQDPDSFGVVTITSNSSWSVEGRLTLGKNGTGGVNLNDGGILISGETRLGEAAGSSGLVSVIGSDSKGPPIQWDTGNLAVGLGGIGEIDLVDADVQSDNAVLGVNAGSSGEVTVVGPSSSWTLHEQLVAGDSGMGRLEVENGASVFATSGVSIGKESGSTGIVSVTGTESGDGAKDTLLSAIFQTITIGEEGEGELHVLEGGIVEASTIQVALEAEGLLRAIGMEGGKQSIVNFGNILIGAENCGVLQAEEAFVMMSENGQVGTHDLGFVNLKSAKWLSSTGEITLGNVDEDEILGTGTVILQEEGIIQVAKVILKKGSIVMGIGSVGSQVINQGGLIIPNLNFEVGPSANTGVDLKQTTAHGELTISGDYNQEDGGLMIEIGGLSEGDYDILHVTGTVDIQGGTIEFVFLDGFLPMAEDEIAFLIADGSASISENVTYRYEGAAPGFQFDVVLENGMLMFHALNDAQPAPVPSADFNDSGEIDFIDLLIFLKQWME